MLDFTELSPDGNELELLIRELLFSRGFNPRWSGKGQDAGRDLLVDEVGPALFGSQSHTWLVSCKQRLSVDQAVGVSELDGIIEACAQHEATGFLLVCSTYPSSGAVTRLDELKKSGTLFTHYWDGVTVERLLSTPVTGQSHSDSSRFLATLRRGGSGPQLHQTATSRRLAASTFISPTGLAAHGSMATSTA